MKTIYTLFLLSLLILHSALVHAENFPRPAELEPDIHFWVRVYTEIDTKSGFIHDARNLAVVYKAINVDGGPRTNKRNIKKVKAHYASILKKLASGKRKDLSAEEYRVLEMWGGEHVSNNRLKSATDDIRFQRGQSNRFRDGIIRSGEWRLYIEQTFKDLGLPIELAALPHVESSFNPKAYSHVGAAGLWQFIRPTGRRYMQIDYLVDERMDPFLSTIAAAKLLRHNHRITNSWPLALTAYNHGVASMRRVINKLGTRDIAIIVRNYKGRAFGFASRNFYVAFLAALEVDRNSGKYFRQMNIVKPFDYELVEMSDYFYAKDIADHLQISKAELKRHNRSLLAAIWSDTKRVPKDFKLRIPKSLLTKPATELFAEIPLEQRYKEQTPDLFHHVVRGDTLSEIADQYGFLVREVMDANSMSSGHYIRVGQKLRLPVKNKKGVTTIAAAKPAQTAKSKVTKSPPVVIAKADLKEADVVQVEEKSELELDVSDVAEPDAEIANSNALLSDPADYTVADDKTIEVQASETLGHYAEWLDLRASRLRKINGLKFSKPVVVGNRLLLDFTSMAQDEFERRRIAYQRNLQNEFFSHYSIQSTYQHTIKRGESLWVLALRKFKVPIWLLRQHNPDVNFNLMRPGAVIIVPNLIEVESNIDTIKKEV